MGNTIHVAEAGDYIQFPSFSPETSRNHAVTMLDTDTEKDTLRD